MTENETSQGKRVAFATIGCRLNQAESDSTRDEFSCRGWQVVNFGQAADVIMVNTCTVTGRADRSSRQLLHRARRDNPNAIVVATGCFAAGHAEDLVAAGEVDLVLGINEKSRPFDYLPEGGRPTRPLIHVQDGNGTIRAAVGTRVSGRSRAFLKVQDGCDHACTYCAVTLVRGPSRSAPLEDIRTALSRILAAGFEEVVLTGVDLTAWGRDLENNTLDYVDLVALAADMGIPRVRISSLEPWEIDPRRIRRLANIQAWCEHLHISLQSADAGLLRVMNRPTDLGLLQESVAELFRLRPKATVGADLIAGFPGESESAFQRSLGFLDEGPLHYLHVFPFSARPGTPAADLQGALDRETIHRRAQALREAARKHKRTHLLSQIGTSDEILIEEDGRSGYTRSYLRAKLDEGGYRARSRVPVNLTKLDDKDDFLQAKVIQ